MVGALVVKNTRIVGRGFHRSPGQPHAEILALRQAGRRARGATLYVTLEPCCHSNKRTPPCVPTIIQSGIRRVVVAMHDPNPLVRGKGIGQLRRAGLAVVVGVGRLNAETCNRAYSHWVRTRRPYVILKAGMTLDGQIATAAGESKWITGKQSRHEVHQLRQKVDAVLIGVGTVLSDDPILTARTGVRFTKWSLRQPVRIVVDSRLRIPLNARILARQNEAKTLVATTRYAPSARLRALEKCGVETMILPAAYGRVSLPALVKGLGQRGITSLLVEGGGEINASMLKSELVQHVKLYIAPSLLGGADARGVIGGRSPARLAQVLSLKKVITKTVGSDVVVEGDV